MNAKFDSLGVLVIAGIVLGVLCVAGAIEAIQSRLGAVVARARSLRGGAGLASSDAASVEKPEGNQGGADRGAAGEDPSRRARRLGIDELLRDESQFEADDEVLFI